MADEKPDTSIRLFKNEEPSGGPWPTDIHEYYDKLDAERGFPPRGRLIQGYKTRKQDR